MYTNSQNTDYEKNGRTNRTILVADGDHHQYTLGHMCARAFASLGHEVRYVNTNTRSLPLVGTNIGIGKMRARFLESVSSLDPDMVFVIKGECFPRSIIERVKAETSAKLCNWNPDNPFMTRTQKRELETYLNAIPAYDCTFIWSEELVSDLYEHGAKRVEHLPFGFDPTIHHPAPVIKEYEADVAFVGHPSDKRKKYMHALAELDINLAIYGDYWQRFRMDSALRRHVRDGTIYGERYCSAFCSADIVVNIVSDHNLEAYNMRTFEVPATGSFMLTTGTKGQREMFKEEQAAAYFNNTEELKRAVRRYLHDEDKRESIASGGANTVSSHSYRQRMSSVISQVL